MGERSCIRSSPIRLAQTLYLLIGILNSFIKYSGNRVYAESFSYKEWQNEYFIRFLLCVGEGTLHVAPLFYAASTVWKPALKFAVEYRRMFSSLFINFFS